MGILRQDLGNDGLGVMFEAERNLNAVWIRSRASTKPPTLLRGEGWSALRGDLWFWQEDEIEHEDEIE